MARDIDEPADWTRTTCPYCGVGCGVLVRPAVDGRSAEVRGDPEHPANFGRLCSKGTALGETLSLDDRLLHPIVDGTQTSWDAALDLVARRFSESIAAYGPDSVALYVSGQILTEDYYVANKLMKGFIGSANIDTNSRLCMASSVAGHKRAFGSDTVPGVYEDLELADLVVLTGSNLAWSHPVLFQRLAAAREARGTKVIVIDPRRTATCEIADQHLALSAGSDVALFNGLLVHLASTGRVDHAYVDAHTSGFDDAIAIARATSIAQVAECTGLTAANIAAFYELFAATERTVTVYSQGVNQSTAGTDKVNAIINCHLATGRIGKPGSGPFSVTGQPNAMGGREVGGLANMLAAHMEIADERHREIVRGYWRAPRIAERPGLKAVELFEAVADGRIRALWIMATNPVDSLPAADTVKQALARCPFVVVSDVARHTDTTAYAHVLLPAAAWGEKDGTVTNSERRISRQRAFLAPPGEARPDWWQFAQVAHRMGFAEAFAYTHPRDIFAEYAGLTGAGNAGTRDLDISAFADVTADAYDALAPFQWPHAIGVAASSTRFFGDGGFFTPDRRGRLVATPHRNPASRTDASSPLVLNTGRIRDQWHTMTRTGKAARLVAHYAEPFIEMHPEDARESGLAHADIAEIASTLGTMLARVIVTERQGRGTVFAAMHWTDQFTSAGRVNRLVAAHTDPISGQPESKFTPVSVRRFEAAWHAFAVTRNRPDRVAGDYWAIAPVAPGGVRLEFAGRERIDDWDTFANQLIGAADGQSISRIAYHDRTAGTYRFAQFEASVCVGQLYISRVPVEVSRTWAIEQLGKSFAPTERFRLLAGRPVAEESDRGAIVCACMNVGRNEIVDAIVNRNCRSVDAVGAFVKAGTNCGSCRSEIARLIDETRLETAV